MHYTLQIHTNRHCIWASLSPIWVVPSSFWNHWPWAATNLPTTIEIHMWCEVHPWQPAIWVCSVPVAEDGGRETFQLHCVIVTVCDRGHCGGSVVCCWLLLFAECLIFLVYFSTLVDRVLPGSTPFWFLNQSCPIMIWTLPSTKCAPWDNWWQRDSCKGGIKS
jgi:hypothetical protein